MKTIRITTAVTIIDESGEHSPGSVVSIEEAEGLALIERFGGEVVKANPKGERKGDDNGGGGASS